MEKRRTVAEWMQMRKVAVETLAASASLDPKVVEAIVKGRYTTSPEQRRRIATALGVNPDEVLWGQAIEVEHMYGHGPQFGRSP
jgi:hypothetical protein